ncbi:venom phosphodiesterase isoform X2 [Nematostella vectensis]|uniref:venom phosphodiesterase isoform X2 n=1 Tax=Nematostella vectensis TaxID=45351 RepID=UPI0020777CCA|nr:venom phosphodiesterase isoform X2 [Nematostella vectensis]
MEAKDKDQIMDINSGDESAMYHVKVEPSKAQSKRKMLASAAALIAVLLIIVIVIAVVVSTNSDGKQKKLKSKKERLPLIVISMDGFRSDYLTEENAPNIMKLAKNGVRAPFIQSQFPTKTFPNYYSIITGLYPIHHGIVANSFYDPELKDSFRIGGPTYLDPKWWKGEPLWQTAMKQGLVSASYFWVGSEVKVQGMLPNFTYTYNKSVPFEHRVDTVLSWLDLPRQESQVNPEKDDGKRRPDFITLYFYQPDGAGHNYGPGSPQVDNETRYVDKMVGRLFEGLKIRSLEDKVNVIMLTDHGMAKTDCKRAIYLDEYDVTLDDIITPQWRGGAFMTLSPRPQVNESVILSRIQCKTKEMRVFTKHELPKRLHYSHSNRIGDIIIIPAAGYLLGTNISYAALCRAGGNHGYDNLEHSMRGIFVASGPAFKKGFIADHFLNTELYNLMAGLIDVKPAPNDGTDGSLAHMLAEPPNNIPVSSPVGDGNLLREDICRYPSDSVATARRNCKYCVCSWCGLNDSMIVQFDKRLDLSDQQIASLKKSHFPWGLPQGGAGKGGCLLTQSEYLTGYSTYLRLPLWVGYRLDGEKSDQSLPRKNCFRHDVRLTNSQASTCTHYYKSGFDRGHMVPNADHDYDEYRPTMNTFLLSNIAPQYHKFNIRDWLNLEIYVRDLASGSTLYVISGSIFDEDADGNRDHDNNITRWIKDDRPNTVAVPTHFYKIITRCNVNKTSLYEVPGCSGRLEVISFILPHRSEYHCQYRTDKEYLLDHSASVRDVERLTGTSFFTDLPPAEQARLKAATPIELWPTK